ncbi:uncharacterized protein PgNI_09532 [Pyricularia grisea]|uniref:Uncharacterized protein n=1 Tax=Pyricularia grisea TaxID=148305 RepID=A0A6P8AS79_PYRGI|nr:uncharacterized protein PgNI_09532 [Pyricularia grisea]TLD04968.1 hypothetical protein PgNI_09532 [Pyricularia grisea]
MVDALSYCSSPNWAKGPGRSITNLTEYLGRYLQKFTTVLRNTTTILSVVHSRLEQSKN